MTIRSIFSLLATAVAISMLGTSRAFVVSPSSSPLQSATKIVLGNTAAVTSSLSSSSSSSSSSFALKMASGNDEEARLRALGYSEDEIKRSKKGSDREEVKVQVNLIPDVDPVTLTALGFGLIAFNFFVLGNLGDGGIAGVIATIINSSR